MELLHLVSHLFHLKSQLNLISTYYIFLVSWACLEVSCLILVLTLTLHFVIQAMGQDIPICADLPQPSHPIPGSMKSFLIHSFPVLCFAQLFFLHSKHLHVHQY